MLPENDSSMAMMYTVDNELFSICQATIGEEQEIVRFISEERPIWLKFTSEHAFKEAMEMEPDSVIVAKDNDNRICGVVTAFPNDDLLVISFALVRKDLRHKGLGGSVGRAIVEKAKGKNIILSCADALLPAYLAFGFKVQGHQTFWSGAITKNKIIVNDGNETSVITKVKEEDVSNVIEYDKILHPYQREWFVKKRISGNDGHLAYVARLDSRVVGYGYISCHTEYNYSIVLFADDEKIARLLFSNLVRQLAPGSTLFLNVPGLDENPHSIRFVEEMGLQKDSDQSMLYLKYPVDYQWRKTFFSEVTFTTPT